MPAILLAIATILSLSAGTALAERAAVKQQIQVASTHIETGSSDAIRSTVQLAARGGDHPEAKAHARATRLIPKADYNPEPETISRGTEP
jgi:hypothetical protein